MADSKIGLLAPAAHWAPESVMYVNVGKPTALRNGDSESVSGRPNRVSAGVECRVMAVQVCAHITGTVWKIQVAVGDSVRAEQSLVILESMKMEMPVEAPAAGQVSRIAVSEGQAVEEGDVLIELT